MKREEKNIEKKVADELGIKMNMGGVDRTKIGDVIFVILCIMVIIICILPMINLLASNKKVSV